MQSKQRVDQANQVLLSDNTLYFRFAHVLFRLFLHIGVHHIYSLLIDCKQTTVTADMIAKTIEHFIQTKHQLPLVVIDYLQLIGMDSGYATQKDNLDRAMKTFIGLVDKYSFPLIAISAIAKQNADSLSLFSASETSRIAYSSVSVLGLESKEGNDAAYTTVNVKVLKNRYGQKPTDITLSFDGRYSRFFEFKPVKSTKGKKAAG